MHIIVLLSKQGEKITVSYELGAGVGKELAANALRAAESLIQREIIEARIRQELQPTIEAETGQEVQDEQASRAP
jgi:hypothetical protein